MELKVDFGEGVPNMVSLVLGLLLFLAMLVTIFGTSAWASRDAEQRGKPGCLVFLLVLMTWPVGLLFWLVARPGVQVSLPPSRRQLLRRCVESGCCARICRTGKIMGTVSYQCEAGHHSTEQA